MQKFGLDQSSWKLYQGTTVTMVQVIEGTAVSTQGQHYVQYKEGHADQRRSLSSHFVNWTISS